jgi:hypothetical protein
MVFVIGLECNQWSSKLLHSHLGMVVIKLLYSFELFLTQYRTIRVRVKGISNTDFYELNSLDYCSRISSEVLACTWVDQAFLVKSSTYPPGLTLSGARIGECMARECPQIQQ